MKKYFWLLCLGGMLGACNSSNPAAKEAAGAVVATAPATATYDAAFVDFAAQFKPASLPYRLDTAQILNGAEENAGKSLDGIKMIDRKALKTYLGVSKIEDLQPYLESYLEKDETAEAPDELIGSYFYALSQPVRTDAFTALVIGCYDNGGTVGPDGTTAYAYLCTFNPGGKFISAVLLAGDVEASGAMNYLSEVTKGVIDSDMVIETTTVRTDGEYGQDGEKPKETVTRTVQKYRVAADGTIKQVDRKQ